MSAKQATLFGEGADFGKPRPSLAKARELVADIVALLEPDEDDWMPDFEARAERLAGRALAMGAHSVARAIYWMPLGSARYGCEQADITVQRVATRWLRRQELARTPHDRQENET